MKNKEIAEIFNRMGTLLQLKDENVFKVRAYFKAAENIENLAEDIATLRQEERLSQIPGVGKALAEKIDEYLDTGKMSAYETLIQEIPESIFDVIRIPSMGPKMAKLFWDEFKIKDIEGLRRAAESGKLSTLPGIREKTVQNILEGIQVVRQGQERMNLGVATRVADEIVAALKELPEVRQIEIAGSLRRNRETIRDIDILIDSTNPKKVMETFVSLPIVKSVNVHGDAKSSILTRDNIQVDVSVVDPKSFGAALLYFTGSKNFNVKLRQIAMKRNMKVNEYGIFQIKGETEKLIASKTEKGCLECLDLPYMPPELREDIGESELFADGGCVIPRLIELKDIKGDLHVHSTWSDGHNTIAEIAEAAQQRGYEYIGISDHSPRLRVAGGVSPENLKKKKQEIDVLNRKYKNCRILFGAEVEIDAEGNLDYDDAILKEFDIVIAAVHSGFEQSREQLTRRISKACQNKYVNIIAHPTGVNLGKRQPYDIDLKAVCQTAVETHTFLEINSFPQRLDLNSSNIYFARSQGVKFSINSDSHALAHLPYIKFGVALARRGWLTKKQVLNTLPLRELLLAIKKA